jgi:two-component system nitrate/nitrite response regulator NarL
MVPSSFNVALVGRNPIDREGLERILAGGGFNIVQSVADPSHLTREYGGQLLIVCEGSFEPESSEAIVELRMRFPDAKLAVLRASFEFDEMVAAFRAGAHGYILTETPCASFVTSLRLVAMGEKVMPSDLVDTLPLLRIASSNAEACRALTEAKLSTREAEILDCLVMGWPNKMISRRLSISDGTVKLHVKTIFRKLQVCNRTQAAIRGALGGFQPRPGSRATRSL